MSMWNGYCSLADFKAYIKPVGNDLTADATDDAFIEKVIERASRRLDDLVGRSFYPRVESHNFDVPEDGMLWFDDDLLEVITLTNGDATTIASTEYVMKPITDYPKYCLLIRDISTTYFKESSTTYSNEQVIALNAVWGYHSNYSRRGFVLGSTLVEAGNLNATLLSFTVASGTPFAVNQVIRLDNELMIVSDVTTNEITVQRRGDNGSTAATHTNGVNVYYWQPMDDVVGLTLEIARMMYRSRYGENVETTAITTPAGVVVNPRSLPVWARELIEKYRRVV